jgi:uncharacterized protein
MSRVQIELPIDQIEMFCRKWKIRELALFGSVLRDDFRPDSDVDVLVTFEEGEDWDLFDIVTMQEEPESLLARKVDLAEKRWVERSKNYIRRKAILSTLEPVYLG